MLILKAGREHRERLALCANRTGKSEGIGAYELTLHLTGLYPPWWEGLRFDHPIHAWTANVSSKETRDINQLKLMGPWGEFGTGMIPFKNLIKWTLRQGVTETVDTVYIKHRLGGISTLGFKSYEQGRESFQGTERHFIWLDEEFPDSIYSECLLRTMATGWFKGGAILCTYTPIHGLTAVTNDFLKNGVRLD